jgi:hypothetical protein
MNSSSASDVQAVVQLPILRGKHLIIQRFRVYSFSLWNFSVSGLGIHPRQTMHAVAHGEAPPVLFRRLSTPASPAAAAFGFLVSMWAFASDSGV